MQRMKLQGSQHTNCSRQIADCRYQNQLQQDMHNPYITQRQAVQQAAVRKPGSPGARVSFKAYPVQACRVVLHRQPQVLHGRLTVASRRRGCQLPAAQCCRQHHCVSDQCRANTDHVINSLRTHLRPAVLYVLDDTQRVVVHSQLACCVLCLCVRHTDGRCSPRELWRTG